MDDPNEPIESMKDAHAAIRRMRIELDLLLTYLCEPPNSHTGQEALRMLKIARFRDDKR